VETTDKEQKHVMLANLKQNLNAMSVIAARAEIVEIMHGEFMKNLTKLVETYDEANVSSFSFLTAPLRHLSY
jgi:hypothetical protein